MDLSGLNCVKEALPASFSLHSVDIMPVASSNQIEQNHCVLTLKNTHNGHLYYNDSTVPNCSSEIRIVHGSPEVHKCIQKILKSDKDVEKEAENNTAGCGNVDINAPGVWTIPFRIPIVETKTTIQVFSFFC
jgi:hypothetical protein